MQRELRKGKVPGATLTGANLPSRGSLTTDTVMDAANRVDETNRILEGEEGAVEPMRVVNLLI